MEEILLTTWDVRNPVNNGINYLSSGAGISSINRIVGNNTLTTFAKKTYIENFPIPTTNTTKRNNNNCLF